MAEHATKALRERTKTSGLLTVKVTRTSNKTVNADLIAANKRAKKRLAESRADRQVMAL